MKSGKTSNLISRLHMGWTRFHWRRLHVRVLAKFAVLSLAILVVLYPYPNVLIRQLDHLANPNALIQPDAPALKPLIEDVSKLIMPKADASTTLGIIESYVSARIPYAWDWDTWGVADYMPTVEETLAAGREDCDGRAVIAASLLTHLGFKAQLVADGAHVWVWTPNGETMGPHAVRTIQATSEGFVIDWAGLRVMPKTLAFGIAVFPLERELILVGVIWLLLLAPGVGRAQAIAAAGMLVLALALFRYGGADFDAPLWVALWMGLGLLGGAVVLCLAHPRVHAPPIGDREQHGSSPKPPRAINPEAALPE